MIGISDRSGCFPPAQSSPTQKPCPEAAHLDIEMPNLRQLEYLVALSETLHFRRAAERANTTQPTLSEQLKALEERLGLQLVERSRSRVAITPVGRRS